MKPLDTLKKEKATKYFSDFTIIVCAICVIVSFLCQIFKIASIVNIVYAFSLLFIFLCYVLRGYVSWFMLILTAMVGVSGLFRGIIVGNSDYLMHIVIVLCTFVCIEVGGTVKITEKTVKRLSFMFLITSLIVCVAYYVGPLKTSYFKHTDAICLNFSNPNAAGLWLTCFFILLAYASTLYKKAVRVLFWIGAAALLPIVQATQSRNSFLACTLLVVGMLATKIFKIKKIPNWLIGVIACLPLIVFFFYMFVIVKNFDFWEKLFSFATLDKGVDSRVSVWQTVLDNFGDCFWIGNYPKYYDSQKHNSLITIFCRFGMPATLVVCALIYRALKAFQERTSFYALLSISMVLFTGCFESSIFIGIAGLYLMVLIIPACASAEIKTEAVTEESFSEEPLS